MTFTASDRLTPQGRSRSAASARLVGTRIAAFVVGLAGLAGCGAGGSGGSATVQGTVGGAAVAAADVVGMNRTFGTGADAITSVSVSITNAAGTCVAIQNGMMPANTRVLGMAVTVNGGTLAPATYAVGDAAATVTATLQVTDGNCFGTTRDPATVGSVTFTDVSSSTLRGSFDLTFADGHVTGDFTAPVCNPNGQQQMCSQ